MLTGDVTYLTPETGSASDDVPSDMATAGMTITSRAKACKSTQSFVEGGKPKRETDLLLLLMDVPRTASPNLSLLVHRVACFCDGMVRTHVGQTIIDAGSAFSRFPCCASVSLPPPFWRFIANCRNHGCLWRSARCNMR